MDQPGQSSGQNKSGGNGRLQQTQQQVDDVMGIMRLNLEKVLEREEKLSELGERMDELNRGAFQFEQQAVKLRRKYWWQNLKMKIIIGVIVSVLLIIIIVWIFAGGDSGSSSTPVADAGKP